jgi:hypothetical protein
MSEIREGYILQSALDYKSQRSSIFHLTVNGVEYAVPLSLSS